MDGKQQCKIRPQDQAAHSIWSLCKLRFQRYGPDKIMAEKNKNKNNEVNWMISNSAKLDHRTKQYTQFGVSASNGSRDMARTKSWQKIKKNNEVNWMVSNSAKLDCRTKQHTQFGVSASNGSRDMARTKSWRKKK